MLSRRARWRLCCGGRLCAANAGLMRLMLRARLYEGLTDEYLQIDAAAGDIDAVSNLYRGQRRWAEWDAAGIRGVGGVQLRDLLLLGYPALSDVQRAASVARAPAPCLCCRCSADSQTRVSDAE